MIDFKFKTAKKTITASVPENWHEVKLKHVLALETQWKGDTTDPIGLLSAFSLQDYSDIENAQGELFEPLFQVLSFVFDAPAWKKLRLPHKVQLNGKLIKPPQNLKLTAFGQKIQALQLLAEDRSEVDKISDILAIYLQPSYDGLFVAERIPYIKKYVLEMKAFDAMPYGIFFLRKLLRSKNYGKIGLKVSLKTLKNLQSITRQVALN